MRQLDAKLLSFSGSSGHFALNYLFAIEGNDTSRKESIGSKIQILPAPLLAWSSRHQLQQKSTFSSNFKTRAYII